MLSEDRETGAGHYCIGMQIMTKLSGSQDLGKNKLSCLSSFEETRFRWKMLSSEIELSKYDIHFILRGSLKSQALENFVAEFNSPIGEEMPPEWVLSVDDASNVKGSNIGIILEGPGNILIKQTLKFEFTSSNNQMKYEALIVGVVLALETRGLKTKGQK